MNKVTLIFFVLTTALVSTLSGQEFKGFFNFSYGAKDGKITLQVPVNRTGQEFLYVNSLSAGIGSNDIGLDRGQLGEDRVVKFVRTGNKLLLIQPNLDYRAVSPNPLEQKAVEEAFAQSVIWGFEIVETKDNVHYVDLTPFLLRDAHGVTDRLQASGQGSYKEDKSRSAVWMERTKSFPKNVEFDALLTFTGDPKGRWIRSVTPSPDAVTVKQHHSFIELPDSDYQPRAYHPYSGFNQFSYVDYAVPIEEPIVKRFIYRHRLEKKNPGARISEAVEPIIYYMDPGCPEPIKSALMEGASWWDQAFQAVGYAPGTFQIKDLPAGADLLDVRYNVIQWVHRSTRGWSYGSSISDPRTGEIIKGHVSLGSLRVRQDFLIAQGLLSPYGQADTNNLKMKELALARLRQLAAHEVGHTIGLSHNFASSTNDRASVMDYPHPLIKLGSSGMMDLSMAYAIGIGEWDKRTILYGYQDFRDQNEEKESLLSIIKETQGQGLLFISDSDSRPVSGAHPKGHLWDNGSDASTEFMRLLKVRKTALNNFGEQTITTGTPLSELEKVLVPVYLLHRYQLEAVSKLIGGVNYQYFVKGDAYEHIVKPVDKADQEKALQALLYSLESAQLVIPEHIMALIPPPAQGYRRDRETFNGRTSLVFDPLSPAESYINAVFSFLFNGDRLSRIQRHGISYDEHPSLTAWIDKIASSIFNRTSTNSLDQNMNQLVQNIFYQHLVKAAYDKTSDIQVASVLRYLAEEMLNKYAGQYGSMSRAQAYYLRSMLEDTKKHPAQAELPSLSDLPPGSPIGCGGDYWIK